jgi:hypothetical protein
MLTSVGYHSWDKFSNFDNYEMKPVEIENSTQSKISIINYTLAYGSLMIVYKTYIL